MAKRHTASVRSGRLHDYLERHYRRFDYGRYRRRDPIALVAPYRQGDPRDLELAALVASSLAYGQVDAIMGSVRRVLDVLGPAIRQSVDALGERGLVRRLSGFRHRWSGPADVAWLLCAAHQAQERWGSLGGLLTAVDEPSDADLGAALARWVARLRASGAPGRSGRGRQACAPLAIGRRFLLPTPADGSTCKRLCMFLRWMVRRPDEPDGVDLGAWCHVDPARLLLPLDTHTKRIGRYLGLIRRRTPGWPMVLEATASLRALDPRDPVKYDFALAHLGIHRLCIHARRKAICGLCPLDPVCLLK